MVVLSQHERAADLNAMQCRMARAALRWSVHDLAKAAEVSPNTVTRFENDGGALHRTVSAMERALRESGVEFLGDHGVRLKSEAT